MTHIMRWLLPVAFAVSAAVSANAETWPDRPIKFISSQAAGGGTDIIGRLVADQLSARVGQPVVYENRPGGGNVIGTQAAARSTPDGYNFFFATAAALVTDPYTFKSLPYDPMTAFVPVARVAEVSFLVLAHPSVPAKSLNDLIALAKAEPDKFSIATSGQRRFSGMVVSWLNRSPASRFRRCHTPRWDRASRTRSPAACRSSSLSVPEAAASLSSGALRPLAVTSSKRLASNPDVPTVAETFPGFDFTGWMLLAAPTGTPEPILRRVNREMDSILKEPALLDRLERMRFSTPGAGTLEGDPRLRPGAARRLGNAGEGDRPQAGVT